MRPLLARGAASVAVGGPRPAIGPVVTPSQRGIHGVLTLDTSLLTACLPATAGARGAHQAPAAPASSGSSSAIPSPRRTATTSSRPRSCRSSAGSAPSAAIRPSRRGSSVSPRTRRSCSCARSVATARGWWRGWTRRPRRAPAHAESEFGEPGDVAAANRSATPASRSARRAPGGLPGRRRRALPHGFGLEEIAGQFDLSESAVRSRLHRARTRLRAILEATATGAEARKSSRESSVRELVSRTMSRSTTARPAVAAPSLPRCVKAPRAVLFDLDGTLADTRLDIAAACNHVLASPRPADAARRGDRGRTSGDGARILLSRVLRLSPDAPVDGRGARPLQRVLRRCTRPNTRRWMPGAREALDACGACPSGS